jgi:hypothetical protein
MGTIDASAQHPAKGTPALDKTGGWIFYAPKDSFLHYHNPLGPGDPNYPNIRVDGRPYPISPSLANKLTILRDTLRDAYPNPQGAAINYSLHVVATNPQDPRLIHFRLNAYELQHDGAGGLKPIDVANDLPGRFIGEPPNYDGLLSVFLNKIPHDVQFGFFTKQTKFDEILKTKQIPNVSGIYLMPPRNNFAEKAQHAAPKGFTLPPAAISNDADNYTVFRFVEFTKGRVNNLVARHMDKIIMSSFDKLPYKALTRSEFLAVLKLDAQTRMEKIAKQFIVDQTKRALSDRQIAAHDKVIADMNADLQVIEKLSELNAATLDKPATIAVAHKNIINDLYGYSHNSKNFPEMQIAKISEVFIDDVTLGYTPCKLVKYYQSTKDEDIQSIMVNWYYELPVSNNPNYDQYPNLDSRSFYMAIRDKLDWKKLEGLLMKSK